ncbi:uncharacterized protein At5g39865-like [Mercurialis annua]|uniref:uncharacterized protein At5g39865-like n=1 Tax=Mercurialis annua TaxID=3986 RepID=UPI00215E7A60|nr:uncharacterized protein At5g39865-like [Mercurialis annua]
MGCASSKQSKRCRNCNAPYTTVPRSYSMHVVHPPQQKGDSYHVVALTSTTLGSLPLNSAANFKDHISINTAIDILTARSNEQDHSSGCNGHDGDKDGKSKDFSVGLIEAKTWSNMIQEKIPKIEPKTPIRTPPGEPETINTWELMAGLEEDDQIPLAHRFRSFSFDLARDSNPIQDSPNVIPKNNQKIDNQIEKQPFWIQYPDEDSNSKCPEFDPEVISTFRRSLQELSPTHPFYIKPSENGEEKQPPGTDIVMNNDYYSKGEKEKLIVYFTSLRGVRKTYEDCCHVRVILKGLGVRVDERDVSMHSGFKDELKELLGDKFSSGGLPRVFIGSKYVGGADEIRRMNEEGKLEKAVDGCETLEDDCNGCITGDCEGCGDIRFVPCETCNGSCKIYCENDDEDEDEGEGGGGEETEAAEEENGEYGFQRCPDCNENGLIRCRICCY